MNYQDPSDRKPAKVLSVKSAVGALVAIVTGILWLATADVETRERDQTTQAATKRLANTNAVAAEYVRHHVASSDSAAKLLGQEWLGARKAFTGRLSALKPLVGVPLIDVSVIGANGRVLFSDHTGLTRLDLSDRDVFKAHAAAFAASSTDDSPLIADPIAELVPDRPSLQLSRRIPAPDGSFGGIIVLSIAPEALTGIHKSLDLGDGGVMTIVGADGIIRARAPEIDGTARLGEMVPNDWPFMDDDGATMGSFRALGRPDGEARLYHWQRLQSLPLVVVTHVREDGLMAVFEEHARTWRLIRWIVIAALLVAGAGLIVMVARQRHTAEKVALYRAMLDQTIERMTGFGTPLVHRKVGLDYRRFALLLIGTAILVTLSLGGIMGMYMLEARNNAIGYAEAQTLSQTRAHQAFLQRTLHDYDNGLKTLGTVVKGGAQTETIRQFITAQMRGNPEILDILILDAEGKIVIWPRPQPPPNVADRPYFTKHRDRPDDLIYVSPLLASKVHPGKFFFAVSRRISAPDGAFAGAAVLILDVEPLAEALQQIFTAAEDISVVITTLDGLTVLGDSKAARIVETIGGHTAPPDGLGTTALTEEAVSSLDGRHRIVAWARVADYPLIVGASMDKDALIGTWDTRMRTAIIVFFIIAALVGGLTFFVLRLAKARFAALVLLQKQRSRMASVIEGTNVGTWEWDIRTSRAWFNERWAAMLGRTLAEFTPANTDTWIPLLHPEDRERATTLLEQHICGEIPHYECEIRMLHSDGSWVWVLARGRVVDWAEDGTPARMAGIHLDISERKAAEQESRDTHDNLRHLLGSLGEGVYGIDNDGRCTWINPAALSMLGFEEAEVLGAVSHDLFHRIYPDGSPYPIEDCPITLTLRDGLRREAEEWFLRKDGEGFSVDLTVTPVIKGDIPVGAVASFHDITQRKLAVAALERNEAMLRGIIEGIPGIFYLFDENGRFLMWNRNMETMTGRSAEMMTHTQAMDLFDDHEKPLIADRIEHARAEGYSEVEAHLVSLNGQRTPYLFNGKRIEVDGRNCVVGVGIDICEIKKFEEELRRSNAELEQFAYVASHDLRQPLRMINSYVQLLQRSLGQKLSDDDSAFFHYVRDGATFMDQMLVSLLDYSRVGRKGEPMQKVDSRALVDDALLFLKPAIEEAHAEIIITGEWPTILVRRNEMVRMFQNLIGNAVKYRAPDRAPIIHLEVEREGASWLFTVRDNGIGIDPAQTDRLFKVFQRLHTRNKYEGTGIGLAICRKIIEHHDGRIGVQSEGEGQGSAFRFTLPVMEA